MLISQKSLSLLRLILGCKRAGANGSATYRNDGHLKFSYSLPRLILGFSSHTWDGCDPAIYKQGSRHGFNGRPAVLAFDSCIFDSFGAKRTGSRIDLKNLCVT